MARESLWGIEVLPENFPSLFSIPDKPKALFALFRSKSQFLNPEVNPLYKLPERGLAIVGTRSPKSWVSSFLRREILSLRGRDLVIVSGFALGLDTVAHEAALDAGLKTVAVLGTGLDTVYPKQNQSLRNRILDQGGVLISERREGSLPFPSLFVNRNRLIAGWSKATLVGQAPRKSGALHTAQWAMDWHRDLYAVPCRPEDSGFEGNQRILDLDHGLAFWSIQSLGHTWIELSTLSNRKQTNLFKEEKIYKSRLTIEQRLLEWIDLKTKYLGGISVNALVSDLSNLDISERDGAIALQKLIEGRAVIEKNGVLLKNYHV